MEELRDVEANIDVQKNPKNYANLRLAIENLLTRTKSKSIAVKEFDSGKSPERIKAEYEAIVRKEKVTTAIFLALWVPNIIAGRTDSGSFLGINESVWFKVSIVGLAIIFWSYIIVSKCPNCGHYPGGGWSRKKCRSCGIPLR